ncbi:FeoB-associated Cys-rich membrane protein [Priestia megaterium]|uniref:FeoB-associated Cys-rich membrane protein n=1 Tax=Priestia megaterium TaxID=1404 RepID=UPI00203EB938|nr:FeoB-associated Cys-rich membrane protein [Priestia megaterium]MCM3150643.1 FeoB-associated Cys-rich membrane protein [Priestia megaterium]
MIINILIGVLIFGYALCHMTKFFRKSTQGKCASCAQQSSCATDDCGIDWDKTIQEAQNQSS